MDSVLRRCRGDLNFGVGNVSAGREGTRATWQPPSRSTHHAECAWPDTGIPLSWYTYKAKKDRKDYEFSGRVPARKTEIIKFYEFTVALTIPNHSYQFVGPKSQLGIQLRAQLRAKLEHEIIRNSKLDVKPCSGTQSDIQLGPQLCVPTSPARFGLPGTKSR
ncbi:hypothetical protein C8R44DRAFT_747429 [Mycena epipterygia]|nr:hypothetical protein C8R44DRAFT_747429 [Mycena epipterygia]